MNNMRSAMVAGAMAVSAALLAGQTVETRARNVYFTAADGQRIQLTEANQDLFPALSPDGTQVAFVRIEDASAANDFTETQQICVVKAELGFPEPACSFVQYQPGESPLAGFHQLAWTPDSRSVYFLSDFSYKTSGLCRFGPASGEAVFVAPANDFRIMQSGPRQGFLVADVQTPDGDNDTYPFFVLSPEGERVERVGEPGEDIEAVQARVEARSR